MMYIDMKKILAFLLFVLIFAPCLLVANESDHIWVNFIGLGYLIGLFLVCQTKVAKKWLKWLDKAIGLTYDNKKDKYY